MLRDWSEDRVSNAKGHIEKPWYDTPDVNDRAWSLAYDFLYKVKGETVIQRDSRSLGRVKLVVENHRIKY